MTSAAIEPVNLDRHEIALKLKVCLQTVDRLVKAQAFPSFKIGGKRLATERDVDAFNDRLRGAAAEAGPDTEAFELLAMEAGHAPAAEPKHTQTTTEAAGTAAPSP